MLYDIMISNDVNTILSPDSKPGSRLRKGRKAKNFDVLSGWKRRQDNILLFTLANIIIKRGTSPESLQLCAQKRFEQIILNTTTLSALDVCEVCGSYQCPYCQFYNSSNVFRTSFILMVLSFIVAQSFVFSYDTVLLPLSLIYDMFNRRIS
ncbi:hypothetical protein Avbf_02632 [Armadillidium vulgare]|nr:hypothetical protein Avbf_02632 [Armadillidium vulgare]